MLKGEATTLSLGRYAPDAKAWIVQAQTLADAEHHAEVTPLHLLARGADGLPGVAAVLARAGVNGAELSSAAARALSALPKASEPSYLSTRFMDLLARAERDADRERAPVVSVAHLLNALSQEIRGGAAEVLAAFGVGPGSLKPHLGALEQAAPRPAFSTPVGSPAEPEARDLVLESKNGQGDPVVGRDAEIRRLVTILERREKGHALLVGEPGTGKRAIVRALAKRLGGADVPARLSGARLVAVDAASLMSGSRLRSDAEQRLGRLVEAGQNTSAVPILFIRGVEQLFGQGAAGQMGDALRSLVAQGTIRLLASTTPEGLRKITERDAAFVRLCTVLEIAEPSVPQAIEMVRSVAARLEQHHGVRIGEGAVTTAVTLAKRYLPDRFLPDGAVGLLDEAAAALRVETDGVPRDVETTVSRLESIRVQIAALSGVDDAPTRASVANLTAEANALEPQVLALTKAYEVKRGTLLAVRGVERELEAARKSLADARSRSDGARASELEHVAIPELERRLASATEAARAAGASVDQAVLGEEQVARMVADWTGIPVAKMLEGEADKLLKMEERLERRVIGQSEGVRALARAVRRGRVGLRDPKRPIGSFLFLGPSGVGKTELAKALAEFLFDDESALTRLDMSEFMERHMAQRLLGAPPGYADSEQGGFLTEAVRKRPYSVLLFDEVEKAHGDVFNLLLQVLDDGRLTDGRGRLADFTNTVVILTSNIGSDRILGADPALFESTEGREQLRETLLAELRKFFRPEFLNRVDDVIVFRPLAKADLARIVEIQLASVQKLLAPRKLSLRVDEDAKARLVDLGHEPALGARPLRRAILKRVQDPLAEKLLERPLPEGTTLVLRTEGEDFVFDTVPPP
ncbi:MAG TPA: AAA family ATPase [Polyangiaceae bacterium]|nr:AAA family ATPase [Polyangiaceae bacterium]